MGLDNLYVRLDNLRANQGHCLDVMPILGVSSILAEYI